MHTISLIEQAWSLSKCGVKPDQIAREVGKDRATIYRWIKGIKRSGIRRYLHQYQNAKKGRRQKRKTDPLIKARIYVIREEFHHCCGEKIRYWMKKHYSTTVSVATIYRILKEKYRLRSEWKKNQVRGPVPKAKQPREVIQYDTVDFGGLYAFTSVDIYTREAQVIMKTQLTAQAGQEALEGQMQYFGFADMLQRDGGSEFKAEWDAEAKQYCHRVRTARPYKKNEQSYIESFNRTLRKECLGWRKYRKQDLVWVQERVNTFVKFYNTERPHLSLNLMSPKEYLSHLR
jgi:transposase InsO family protein